MPSLKKSSPYSQWMARALELAERGCGSVEPNPCVGAVVLDKRGRFAGEGYHRHFGGPHAEVEAIMRAGRRTQGGTLIVTLEPCSTYGKTPPCTELILRSGIRKVVYGITDPNPRHKGRGLRMLRRAGILVAQCGKAHDFERQNEMFLKSMRTARPFVSLKMAESLDGKIATASGESKWITGKKARSFVQLLRARHDAVLVGTNTLRLDKPGLLPKGIRARVPRRVFIVRDPRELSSYLKRTAGPRDIIFSEKLPRLAPGGAELIKAPFPKGRVDIGFVLKTLGSQGLTSLLVEGGGEMAASFLEGRWVDRVYFFIAPLIIGGRTARTSVEGQGVRRLVDARRLGEVECRKMGEDLLITGIVKQ